MPFDREIVKVKAAELAAKGVFIGTSSWKYEGWFGQLYTPARYEYRGKVAKTRFQRDSLSKYAEVIHNGLPRSGVLHASGRGLSRKSGFASSTGFQIGFKVTDDITMKKFPNLDRFGMHAGKLNDNLKANP